MCHRMCLFLPQNPFLLYTNQSQRSLHNPLNLAINCRASNPCNEKMQVTRKSQAQFTYHSLSCYNTNFKSNGLTNVTVHSKTEKVSAWKNKQTNKKKTMNKQKENSLNTRGLRTKQRNLKILAYKLFHAHGGIGVLAQHTTCRN